MPLTEATSLPAPHVDRRAVEGAARRLVRTWRTTVAVLLVLAVVIPVGLGWALLASGSARTNLIGCLTWLLLIGALLAAFVPSAPDREQTVVVLDGAAETEVRDWVRGLTAGWQPRSIVLAPDARVDITWDGSLRLGAALVACLDEAEVALLVLRAHARRAVLLGPALTAAHGLLAGDVGRGLRNRRRLGPLLLRGYEDRARQLEACVRAWDTGVDEHQDEATVRALRAAEVVDEAQRILVDTYLGPALHLGAWHDTPFTGLSQLLHAWEQDGVDVRDGSHRGAERAEPPTPARDALPETMRREAELAERMLDGLPHDPTPTSWEDQPERVDLPLRRQRAAAVLEAGQLATGRPVPATLAAVVGLARDGWFETVAAHLLGPAPAPDGTTPNDRVRNVTVTAVADALALTLVETGAVTPVWSWPDGPRLVTATGAPLDARAAAEEALPAHAPDRLDELLEHTARVGGRPDEPVWLDGGPDSGPELALYAFPAVTRGWRQRRVVITDRAVRTFTHGWGSAYAMNLTGDTNPLGPLLDAVTRGDLSGQVDALVFDEVIQAAALPSPTGMAGWSLRVRTLDDSLHLTVMVSPHEVVPQLRQVWGERLDVTWWALPRVCRWLRLAWAWTLVSAGCLGIIMTIVFAFMPPDDLSRWWAVPMAVGTVAALAATWLPDWLLLGWRRFRLRPLPTIT